MKVIAAMSGGVDSAVAAARMVDAGHEVIGVHLALSSNPQKYRSGARGCCTIEDSHDARRAADVIGIPFYIWDMAEEFHDNVVENFIEEYSQGRTPNPCLRCNEKIKFAAVLDRATALGYDAVATGHYAQLRTGQNGLTMHRAVDPLKDQSYVLAVLNRNQIAGALFPLGDTKKEDVRREAKERGLYVANKPDSHDICFIPSGNNAGWLRDRLGNQAGPIVNEAGEQIGEHEGAFTYTIGQRRGLHLSVPTESGSPRYVLQVDAKTNTVVVGSRESLAVTTIVGANPIWCGDAPKKGVQYRGFAQVRAHGSALACTYTTTDSSITAQLDEPLMGLAAGQGLAIYDGDRVVGSATVSETY
jgi:tRNA-uridine 2-sulfurtransferase